jgi:hypothetical protein
MTLEDMKRVGWIPSLARSVTVTCPKGWLNHNGVAVDISARYHQILPNESSKLLGRSYPSRPRLSCKRQQYFAASTPPYQGSLLSRSVILFWPLACTVARHILLFRIISTMLRIHCRCLTFEHLESLIWQCLLTKYRIDVRGQSFCRSY